MANSHSIALGINIFGSFHRQDLCIESLLRIRRDMPNVTLYNIQQLGQPITEHADFKTIFDKGRTAADVVANCTSKLPMVRDFFDALADQGKDYFVFLNSDIILTKKIIKLLSYNLRTAVVGSRLAIEDIKGLDQGSIVHSHFQIAGFDVFAIQTSWWNANRHLFPDYVYAVSAWDVDYASRLAVLGITTDLDIDMPAPCYHIMHEEKSHNDTPERAHNMKLFFEDSKPLCDAWHSFLFKILEMRTPLDNNYTVSARGENAIKKHNFLNENIYTFCSNWRGL